MIQILPGGDPRSDAFGRIGKSIGSGISSLLEDKIEQMKTSSGLSALGVPKEKAKAFSTLPKQFRDPLILNYLQSDQFQQDKQPKKTGFQELQQPQDQVMPQQAQQPQQQMPAGYSNQDIANRMAMEAQMGQQPVGQQQAGIGALPQAQPFPPEASLSRSEFAKPTTPSEKLKLASMQQKERHFQQTFTEKGKELSYKQAYKEKSSRDAAIKNARDSARISENVIKYVKTGNVDTGLKRLAKEKFGIENLASASTQAVAKLLAAEPIRSLSSIPGQSARLSKVFDTITKMTPTLTNTKDGLLSIARLRLSEAKASELIDSEILREQSRYIENNQAIPLDLEQRVVKKIQPKLDNIYRQWDSVLGENIGIENAKLNPKSYNVGTEIFIPEIESNFRLTTKDGKKVWVPFYPEGK